MSEYYERDESAHYEREDWYDDGCDECNLIQCVCDELGESAIAEDSALELSLFADA
jgi:hypothetical protein